MLSFCMTVCGLQTAQTDDRTQFCIYFSIFYFPRDYMYRGSKNNNSQPHIRTSPGIVARSFFTAQWRLALCTANCLMWAQIRWQSGEGRSSFEVGWIFAFHNPHHCHCGSAVDARVLHSFVCKRAPGSQLGITLSTTWSHAVSPQYEFQSLKSRWGYTVLTGKDQMASLLFLGRAASRYAGTWLSRVQSLSQLR